MAADGLLIVRDGFDAELSAFLNPVSMLLVADVTCLSAAAERYQP